jgi:hypothetical protein
LLDAVIPGLLAQYKVENLGEPPIFFREELVEVDKIQGEFKI